MRTAANHRVLIRAGGATMIAMVLVAVVPSLLRAQTHGIVLDSSDRPVANAVVELWAASRFASGTTSDEDGRFEISARPTAPLVLTVRRLGFRTRTIELNSIDTTLVVKMDTQALVLDGIFISATAGRPCPNREDPRARALWEEMRSRYWQPSSDSVFVYGFMELRSGSGEQADAFRPEIGQVRTGWTTGALVTAHPELMVRSGYASPANGGVGERTAFWDYRALDHGAMQDFTGAFFGNTHTLSISSAGDQWIIAFCPRERSRQVGQVEGTIHLHPDKTLKVARWQFVTPAPDEDAGGEASYYAPDPVFDSALLARETFFWRRSSSVRYYFEGRTFTGWRRWYRESAADASTTAATALPPRTPH